MSKFLQSNMCLNPDTGEFEIARVESELSLDRKNNYIRSDDNSKKSLVDLGYTIENVETALFYINDILLTKQFVEHIEELRDIEILPSEIYIITNEPAFKSTICVASENISTNNILAFHIDSYSSTIRVSILEDMNDIKLTTIEETENIKNISIAEIIEIKTDAITETQNIKSASIAEITNTKTDSIATINEIKDSAQTAVENIKTISIAEITATKTDAITETESIKNLAIDEITNISQNFQEYVDSLGDILASIEGKVDDEILLGMMFDYVGDIEKLPLAYMICDGREVSRVGVYSKVFGKLGAIWGDGNGSTTFNLPDGRGAVSKGAGSSNKYTHNENRGEVGSYQSTAIRNITGNFDKQGTLSDGSNHASGAFSYVLRGNHFMGGGTSSGGGGVFFDASRIVPTGATNRDNNFAVIKVIYIGG